MKTPNPIRILVSLGLLVASCSSGEPGAVRDVNEAADSLLREGAWREVQQIADDLMTSAPVEVPFVARWDEAPPGLTKRLPERLWRMGDRGRRPPGILRLDRHEVRFIWPVFGGNSHEVVVRSKAPTPMPVVYFGRIVSDRLFVLHNHHCERCLPQLVSHSRTRDQSR